jgi:hypothetical protein
MNRPIAWCVVTGFCLVVAGCADDVSSSDLGKLAELTPKPKTESTEQTGGAGDASTEPDPATDATTEQDNSTGGGGYGGGGGGYGGGGGGYGGGGGAADQTYGQGAPIKLKSEVDNQDLAQAEGGVGRRGQGYGGGIVTEPIRQRFILQDRITFMNMQNTLKIYRAEHNDQNPQTIQEFVDEIVTPSGLTLPELPRGHFYVYDPSAKGLEDILLVDQTQTQQQ